MSTLQIILANIFTLLGWTNTSTTSIWYKMAQAMSIPVDNTITELSNNLTTINSTISNKNYGRAGWYVTTSLAFQYGYSLSIDPVTLQYFYATIDPTALIISQAAFENSGSGLFLKVATLTGSTLGPLSSDQLTAFQSYFNVYELPGLPVTIISIAPNILNFSAIATYSAAYDLPTLKTNISNALTAFASTFQFDGVLYIANLQTYMTVNVPGLISFYVSGQQLDSVSFGGQTNLTAGYFDYSPNVENQIQYQPV